MWTPRDAPNVDPRLAEGPEEVLMDAVDGNAIGGLLIAVFGTEMTATNGTCGRDPADPRTVEEPAHVLAAPR